MGWTGGNDGVFISSMGMMALECKGGSKLFLLEVVVAAAFEEAVLEGEFGEGAELVVVVLFGVAADDVVGLLLPLVDAEPLEALLALRHLGTAARGVHVAQV